MLFVPICFEKETKSNNASPDFAQILATVMAAKSRLNFFYLKTHSQLIANLKHLENTIETLINLSMTYKTQKTIPKPEINRNKKNILEVKCGF
jgi:hypothetical protein